MALFKKTFDELREVFVRARFAEEQNFGRPDIEEWIKAQYNVEVPDNPETASWHHVLKNAGVVDFVHGGVGLLLQRFATTLHDLGLPRHLPTGYSAILPMVKNGLYWGRERGVYLHPSPLNTQAVYLVRGNAPENKEHSLTFECVGRNNLKTLHEAVLEVFFEEWRRGDPRRLSARQWLCEAVDVEIRRERERAEHDFDTAVAVSADGTKIVHADYVVVVPVDSYDEHGFFKRKTSTMPMWPASAFANAKIRRSDQMLRTNFPQPNERWGICDGIDTADMEFSRQMKSAVKVGYSMASRHTRNRFGKRVHHGQVYCEMHLPSGMQRLLFTSSKFCPSPLPDGGVEMAVTI